MMAEKSVIGANQARTGGLGTFLRKCLFSVVSVGPIPDHIAFIMDGNRRFAKRRNMPVGEGHKAGYVALMHLLRYCYELGVKYVTVYAFSIDNFRRRPEEVQTLMDLLQEKIEALLEKESIVNQYGIRVYFIGNLKLLSEPVRVAAEKAMKATSNNSKAVLLICIAYTSCDEIVHAVEESCNEKRDEIQQVSVTKVSNGVVYEDQKGAKINGGLNGEAVLDTTANHVEKVEGAEVASKTFNGLKIEDQVSEKKLQNIPSVKVVDIEKHMYMAVAPDPDIMVRTSGETRLSNFLLWQTTNCPLYSPAALWPEMGLWHLVWAVLNYQRNHYYLEKKRKQI